MSHTNTWKNTVYASHGDLREVYWYELKQKLLWNVDALLMTTKKKKKNSMQLPVVAFILMSFYFRSKCTHCSSLVSSQHCVSLWASVLLNVVKWSVSLKLMMDFAWSHTLKWDDVLLWESKENEAQSEAEGDIWYTWGLALKGSMHVGYIK